MITLEFDFYNQFLHEGSPFYNDLRKLGNKNSFNIWVHENFRRFKVINKFREVVPSSKTLKELREKNYVHHAGQCHYSAKALCILLNNCDYVTGFIRCSNLEFPIITHSFNLLNGKLTDITRLDENFKVIQTYYFPLSHEYFGVVIPKSFVNNFKEETFSVYSMNPLINEWYINQTDKTLGL
ncbi:MAG: hypothetical protein NTX61_07095 [Bacteroidetes bacterium]|nr:hypothetical protein [Bacteroidota bacterium]